MTDVVDFGARRRARQQKLELAQASLEYRAALGAFFDALVDAIDAGVDIEMLDGALLARDAAGRETRIAL